MPQAGYDNMVCLAFDLACVSFANRFERMRDARKEVPLTAEEKAKRKRPTMQVPEYTTDELIAMLELNTGEESAIEVLSDVMDTSAWADFDDTPE